MFPAVPLRQISDFGKDEGRRDGIQRFAEVKHARTVGAAGHEVGQIFVSASFGDNARHQIAPTTGHGHHFDERKFFVEGRKDIRVSDLLPAVK